MENNSIKISIHCFNCYAKIKTKIKTSLNLGIILSKGIIFKIF